MKRQKKNYCSECKQVSNLDDMLEAVSPFSNDIFLMGCPVCLEANCLQTACEYEGCDQTPVSGEPAFGYRYLFLCSRHSEEARNTAGD